MTAFLLLTFAMLLLGAATRHLRAPAGLADSLNWWSLNVALPSMVLELLPGLRWHAGLWFLVAAQWLGFAIAFAFFRWLGPRLGWTPGRTGAVTLMCGLSNTAFVGFPMIEALRGQPGLTLAVISDQLGCTPMMVMGGALTAAVYTGTSRPTVGDIARRMALFPAFWAVWIGLAMGALQLVWPTSVVMALHRLSQTLVPVVLFAIGIRLRLSLPRSERTAIALSLLWRLLLTPAATWLLARLLGVSGLVLTIAVLEMAMAPMFAAAMICNQRQLDPDLANSVVSIGLLLSFLTVPLWNHWL